MFVRSERRGASSLFRGLTFLGCLHPSIFRETNYRSLHFATLFSVFAHRPDPMTPIEETVRAFNYLIDSGKVLSNSPLRCFMLTTDMFARN